MAIAADSPPVPTHTAEPLCCSPLLHLHTASGIRADMNTSPVVILFKVERARRRRCWRGSSPHSGALRLKVVKARHQNGVQRAVRMMKAC